MTLKYYTNFCFEGFEQADFHCTHAYLGELSGEELISKILIIKTYFTLHALYREQMEFRSRALFGPAQDRPVLLLSSSDVDLHLELRKELLAGINPEFPVYRPHVTTNLDFFTGTVDRYSLIQKSELGIEVLFTIPAVPL
jgi:hypothetical protein